MPDNTVLNAGVGGDTVATDDIGGVKYQRVKMAHGADGSATDVSSASPLPTRQVAGTGTVTSVAAAAASGTVLAANADRRGALLYNDSTSAVYVKFGAVASAASFTKRMLPAELFEVHTYTGIIDAIWDAANGNMRITELTV